MVGSLRYLVNTRPDSAYSVGIVSRHMEAPTTQHMAAVKHILRYISETADYGLRYEKHTDGEPELMGYSNTDHAGDVDDQKSTSGIFFFLGCNPISWASQKQRIVAQSACKAEYIAAALAASQGVWLSRLQADLQDTEPDRWRLLIDNKSAIALSKNPVLHERTKHIDLRYHYIRECVENGQVKVEHVSTSEQVADILTKPLGRVRFLELRQKMVVIELKRKRRA